MNSRELLIRGGTVVHGTGDGSRITDILVRDDTIAAVGNGIETPGCAEMDASGLLVPPGLVDVHTHYDGQATWEHTLGPSTGHGVTTVVTGNCGVGFAPYHPGSGDDL